MAKVQRDNSRHITEILKDGAWKGRRAFVVGSGPSMRGFQYDLLKDELTIGCNEEFRWTPTIAMCQDVRWIEARKDDAAYRNCKSIKVYCKSHPDYDEGFTLPDWVYLITPTTTRKGRPWGHTLDGGVANAACCGIPALNLADILGADPIYLLGFDCRADDAGRVNGHDRYPPEWQMPVQRNRFGLWIKQFRSYAKDISAHVVNLNYLSALDCFPKAHPGWVKTAEGLFFTPHPAMDGEGMLS